MSGVSPNPDNKTNSDKEKPGAVSGPGFVLYALRGD